MEFDIEMCYANNEKWKTTHGGRNRTTKFLKNQKALKKKKLQILGNAGCGHNQICGDERKKIKTSI